VYRVNINDYIKVKLTDHGINLLKQQCKEFYEMYGVGTVDYEPIVDDQGYAVFQMHDLMDKLGPYIGVCKPLPFETEIIVTKAEPITL